MAKRHVYKGSYTKRYPASLNISLRRTNMIKYIEAIFKYLCAAYRTAVSNYLPIVTVVIVITLSLLLPNKVNKNNELKEINQVLGHMTDEVNRAEVACLTASDEVQCLRHSICNQETETSSIRRRNNEIYQCAQAETFSPHNQRPFKSTRKLVSFVDSSLSETYRERK
ncbi:uncharacterized protein LOC116774625 isoform X2 [Danaus plexippus]|uniref:uncharacterized protein LOC116774625 isoform X2 n=1 Tax=Danaus plexippus TaxID=13037 RepID=UPI0013C459A9|nr:uncharacterized protein LOC116774625 isoform X2 [Danaus plexippus]